jgi:hypothetical protein
MWSSRHRLLAWFDRFGISAYTYHMGLLHQCPIAIECVSRQIAYSVASPLNRKIDESFDRISSCCRIRCRSLSFESYAGESRRPGASAGNIDSGATSLTTLRACAINRLKGRYWGENYRMRSNERLPRTRRPLTDIPFIFESYRELTERLGAVDGHAATLAIAARYFIDQSKLSDDEQALGLSLAPLYEVSTRYVDLRGLASHLHQLLIVATTKHAEDFLIHFIKEQRALGRVWRTKHDKEDRLSYVLDCIGDGLTANVSLIGAERFELLQYYRLVRNATAHRQDQRARLDNEYEKVRKYKPLIKEEYKLDGPNPFEQTQFDDHMIYTRLVKYLATDLCRLAPPRTFQEFRTVLIDRENFIHEPRFIDYDKGTRGRLVSGLTSFLKLHYNFRLGDHPNLADDLVFWIQNIPSRRYRRENRLGTLAEFMRRSIADVL